MIVNIRDDDKFDWREDGIEVDTQGRNVTVPPALRPSDPWSASALSEGAVRIYLNGWREVCRVAPDELKRAKMWLDSNGYVRMSGIDSKSRAKELEQVVAKMIAEAY